MSKAGNTSQTILGIDIGGTKTAVVLGTIQGKILSRAEMLTPDDQPFEVALNAINKLVYRFLENTDQQGFSAPFAISVAIGGPLDIDRGIIYSPPHLPFWDNVPLKDRLQAQFDLPVYIEHDGNAGALAEFYFGAGRGTRSMLFLTLGTGLGAGMILDGELYRGATDTAGEVGHIRVAETGPDMYGKTGSWEGLCSGAGLAKLAHQYAPQVWAPDITTQEIIQRALAGDSLAQDLIVEVGTWLGKGMAILVDILNPERIVVGTLGVVLGELLLVPARKALAQEALSRPAQICQVVQAQLGNALGDVSALMAVIEAFRCGILLLPGIQIESLVANSLRRGLEARQHMITTLQAQVIETAQLILDVYQRDGKILVFGNGGSAAFAQHLAGELVGRYRANRVPLPAIALNTDTSVLTCIANDYAFEDVFARQVQALAQAGDLVIGCTTSGNSPNVLRALATAAKLGAHTIALTGANGLAEPVSEHVLAVPCPHTAQVQEEHEAILHAWCEVVDARFSEKKG